jgi:perosamine synthetase
MKPDEVIKFVKTIYETDEFIPLHAPLFSGNEKAYLMDVIDSTFVSSVGQYVDKFETMITQITGAKYAIATVNGTSALHSCLILAGVEKEDQVITQPLTFVATANAISYCGAEPLFVDVNRHNLGMDALKLEQFLVENAKTDGASCINKKTKQRISACVPMHTYGFCANIEQIAKICKKWNIPLIEDAAESLGTYNGQVHTGNYGLLSAISFNGNKVVTSGGGGVIITNDEKIAKRAKHITTTAKTPHNWNYVHDEIGFNYRMPNINAALACAQLEKLDIYLKSKRNIALRYKDFFANSDIEFVFEATGTTANYWLNTLILRDKNLRDEFLNDTNANKIMTRPAWEILNKLSMFSQCQTGNLDNANWLVDRIVNIPSSVKL